MLLTKEIALIAIRSYACTKSCCYYLSGLFLPYGQEAGDTSVTLTSGHLLGPIELKLPIYLYNKPLESLYVRLLYV